MVEVFIAERGEGVELSSAILGEITHRFDKVTVHVKFNLVFRNQIVFIKPNTH